MLDLEKYWFINDYYLRAHFWWWAARLFCKPVLCNCSLFFFLLDLGGNKEGMFIKFTDVINLK